MNIDKDILENFLIISVIITTINLIGIFLYLRIILIKAFPVYNKEIKRLKYKNNITKTEKMLFDKLIKEKKNYLSYIFFNLFILSLFPLTNILISIEIYYVLFVWKRNYNSKILSI